MGVRVNGPEIVAAQASGHLPPALPHGPEPVDPVEETKCSAYSKNPFLYTSAGSIAVPVSPMMQMLQQAKPAGDTELMASMPAVYLSTLPKFLLISNILREGNDLIITFKF